MNLKALKNIIIPLQRVSQRQAILFTKTMKLEVPCVFERRNRLPQYFNSEFLSYYVLKGKESVISYLLIF